METITHLLQLIKDSIGFGLPFGFAIHRNVASGCLMKANFIDNDVNLHGFRFP